MTRAADQATEAETVDDREPGEARTLGRALLLVGVVCLFTVAVPFSPTAPTGVGAVLGTAALLLGATVRRWADHLGPAVRHGLLLLATAAVTSSLLTATTDAGRAVTSYGFVWIAVFSAWFHPRRAVAAHVAVIGVGLALALWLTGAPAPLQTWAFVMASVGGVAAASHGLVGRLRHLARHDQLTGLLNRRAFVEAAEAAIADARRSPQDLALAVLDLDDFKEVNDQLGHAAGDELLVELAHAWAEGLRRGDVLARQGGDEFVLLLPGTTVAEAERLLERLHATTGAAWSSGVAAWPGGGLDRWLREADDALYRDKAARRAAARPGACVA